MPRQNRWIQGAQPKKGALHRQLGYPSHDTIPLGVLRMIKDADVGTHIRGQPVTPLLKKRVNFALNVRKR
jgi:hypothetical protein